MLEPKFKVGDIVKVKDLPNFRGEVVQVFKEKKIYQYILKNLDGIFLSFSHYKESELDFDIINYIKELKDE